LPEITRIVTHY